MSLEKSDRHQLEKMWTLEEVQKVIQTFKIAKSLENENFTRLEHTNPGPINGVPGLTVALLNLDLVKTYYWVEHEFLFGILNKTGVP